MAQDAPSPRQRIGWTRERIAAAVSFLVFAGYVGIAHGVQDLYPFSRHGMYAHVGAAQSNRIAVRGADGELREVRAYEGWSCTEPLELDPQLACREHGAFFHVPYLDEEATQWIAEHPGAPEARGAEDVLVVRRIFDLRVHWSAADCVIGRCRAKRR
jgi:hypothetical protein